MQLFDPSLSASPVPSLTQRMIGALQYGGRVIAEILGGRQGWRKATCGWIVVGMVALRASAPVVITALINRTLEKPGAIQGNIEGVSLGIFSGRYDVEGLMLTIPQDGVGDKRVPLLVIDRIACRVSLAALLRGRLEGSLLLDRATLETYVAAPGDPKRAWSLDDWRSTLANLVRFRIAEATLSHGTVRYHDPLRRIDTQISDIEGFLSDLIVPAGSSRPAQFRFNGVTPGQGHLQIHGRVLADPDLPQAAIRASIEDLSLPALNPLLKTYRRLAFARGIFSAYCELEVVGDRLNGYVKPIFRQLDVLSFTDKQDGVTERFWKTLVPVAEYILRNVPADQHAAKIPLSGRIENPKAGVWSTITSALSNAFISAIVPGFDRRSHP